MLGKGSGRHLHALAHNRDPRPVQTGRRRRSIGAQRALGWRPKTADDIDAALLALVDRVTRRMRAANRKGRTVTLRLRFDDTTRATRSHTLPIATANTHAILTTARVLLVDAQPLIDQAGLTLIGVSVSNLDNADAVQLVLPLDRLADPNLEDAMDRVRDRFGSGSVVRSVLVGRDPGLSMPMLPD
jgi:DNA polymerase-4